ncbi:hypothetical protein ACE6H2_012645 [Prunus campanulata]
MLAARCRCSRFFVVHVSCVLSTAFPWSASLGVKSGIYFILWSYIVLSVSEPAE